MSRKLTPGYDLVIVGSGVAGLGGALCAAAEGRVLIVSKGPVLTSSSWLAQGGIAAATAAGDAPELHAADTLAAGRGLCRESAVRALTGEAPARIVDLVDLGVRFDDELGLEGGHSRRRVHSVGGAQTGREISQVLARAVLAHPRIDVSERERALELWMSDGRCVGLVTDARAVSARAVVLATGGYAALWDRTTNPAGSVGEGIEMAFRAGAAVADLEFVQFHPTALAGSSLLLSEALRGDGALLVDEQGDRFVEELAPRDVVARAVAAQGHAMLDLRPIDRSRFPALMERIVDAGFHPETEPVPVAAAAHYTMGGVMTDLDGATDVPGLYAAGECACTGVHGANRLASNSMLECLVFGRRAALAALEEPRLRDSPSDVPVFNEATVAVIPELREALWEDAGLLRNADGLGRLTSSPHLLTSLVARSALAREESRGGHFREDFPTESAAFAGLHTVLRPAREPELEPWS
ncbi:MAG TPA: FAD-binding protein [Gaiellaceae bacterium]